MPLRYPASVHPEAMAEIAKCSKCEPDRRPRMFVCDWHDGYDNGIAWAIDQEEG